MKTLKPFSAVYLLNLKSFYLFLFISCLGTRILTSIDYLEDIDSMRFALSLFDYNISELRPHFPGYPIFCFFAKIIYSLIGSVQLTFSVIGGISTFIIIFYSNLIFEMIIKKRSLFLSALIFINPFIWNLGNRYMSDLLGLSFLIMSTYYLLSGFNLKQKEKLLFGILLIGISTGIRISFLPFLLPLFLYITYYSPKISFLNAIGVLTIGILIWLIPLSVTTGLDNLISLSLRHISGHFFEWGGSVISSNSTYAFRLLKTLESIWADGMGGFWSGRNKVTIIVSLGWILSFIFNYKLKSILKEKSQLTLFLLFASIFFYFIWIFLFQNVVYKPRHILPILPFVLMISSTGLIILTKSNNFLKLVPLNFLCVLALVTSYLNWQHQFPSAISQAKTYVINDESSSKVFVSSSLINSYMKKHNGSENIIFSNNRNINSIKKYYDLGFSIYSTVGLKNNKMNLTTKSVFYHNPYVNRLWPIVEVYKYKTKS
tara:strand:+ start:41 stop:1501 length:1461 start_codon:yes stop_codon:yes gene_type:complete